MYPIPAAKSRKRLGVPWLTGSCVPQEHAHREKKQEELHPGSSLPCMQVQRKLRMLPFQYRTLGTYRLQKAKGWSLTLVCGPGSWHSPTWTARIPPLPGTQMKKRQNIKTIRICPEHLVTPLWVAKTDYTYYTIILRDEIMRININVKDESKIIGLCFTNEYNRPSPHPPYVCEHTHYRGF